ncbi:sialate O-acetylesterase [Nocardioides humilatus]|uniref:Sialate O-acetylesterase n=1 Tax=Nocardioides humilatus TaxID=2607660 RepID=A0A5B1LFI8_9ACTN|nr:sialate O-acetylesterase [Nocardioides humilatus]KAA1419432.1 sialate O-acetylesterase [Nocardioides humilatus]
MHILAIGQSNLANHCGTAGASEFGEALVNGELYPLSDPVRGGTGPDGSVWPRVADRLAGQSWPGSLRLTLAAVGATSIAEWLPGAKCFTALAERFAAGDGEGVTHVVWQQGEKDTLLETSTADYTAMFLQLYEGVTDVVGVVPWIICRSSYRMGVTNPDVIEAQAKLAASLPLGVEGPYLDSFGPELRRDDTHFNDAGLEQFADLLVDTLLQTAPEAAS